MSNTKKGNAPAAKPIPWRSGSRKLMNRLEGAFECGREAADFQRLAFREISEVQVAAKLLRLTFRRRRMDARRKRQLRAVPNPHLGAVILKLRRALWTAAAKLPLSARPHTLTFP